MWVVAPVERRMHVVLRTHSSKSRSYVSIIGRDGIVWITESGRKLILVVSTSVTDSKDRVLYPSPMSEGLKTYPLQREPLLRKDKILYTVSIDSLACLVTCLGEIVASKL